MKNMMLTTIAVFMLAGTTFSRELSDMANRLVRTAERVQMTVEDLEYGHGSSMEVRRSIDELKVVLNRLERNLGAGPGPGPGPINPFPDFDRISASCRLDIDGNFFNPDTSVECTVYGRNAAGYEVRVISQFGNRVEFQGRLNPGMQTQSFATIERKVGGSGVRYQVFILTTNGGRFLVATL
ncbi:MAG: hypothetical protein A2381_01545 [Bdellovibrionales bacterium RIFOXYB1_FULL_37_110]|nr:MAG: hypothetical protein A2417_02400 [Bdellovibrionales bacterium RIFOXYC1_FULL_37_79]OFZ58900.1 MAG: hypothetical protein A2381_01545 [Bdellovibrionales bacterium RIFOXYB1_FULL_37_110]OFZ64654.1 MAG: hypothetical protein A2577_13390 [Bdellovibrionales bacterium RIFOXYD1_FULL_36_51]